MASFSLAFDSHFLSLSLVAFLEHWHRGRCENNCTIFLCGNWGFSCKIKGGKHGISGQMTRLLCKSSFNSCAISFASYCSTLAALLFGHYWATRNGFVAFWNVKQPWILWIWRKDGIDQTTLPFSPSLFDNLETARRRRRRRVTMDKKLVHFLRAP